MKPHEILQQEQEIWDLFTRKEEYQATVHDRYDRFPHYASEYRKIFEPLASKYLIEHGYNVEYPDGKPFAICLTHDIDHIYRPILRNGLKALLSLRHGRVSEWSHRLNDIRLKKTSWWNFNEIMAIEERYGAKSSFYFRVQDPETTGCTYKIEDCEGIMKTMSDRGWEVGLHGGHSAYNDPAEIIHEKAHLEKVLEKKVVGYRNHFLRMHIPETWGYIANAGFKYDTTAGYADCIGFRNGMCHPYRPYNLRSNHEIDILEIPLTIMDATLFRHMNLDFQRAWDLTEQLTARVERLGGVLTVLWHNTSFSGDEGRFYERILKCGAKRNAWMTSGEDIENWIKNDN